MTITAVFGVDDSTSATIDVVESPDVAALAGTGIQLGTVDCVETQDTNYIFGAILLECSVSAIEQGDTCQIAGVLVSVLPSQPSSGSEFFVNVESIPYLVRVPKEQSLVEKV